MAYRNLNIADSSSGQDIIELAAFEGGSQTHEIDGTIKVIAKGNQTGAERNVGGVIVNYGAKLGTTDMYPGKTYRNK
jgi:hypothetical protein